MGLWVAHTAHADTLGEDVGAASDIFLSPV